MIDIAKVRRTETAYRRGQPKVRAIMSAEEAVELGEFLQVEFPNDGVGTDFGRCLIEAGLDAQRHEEDL